MKKLRDSERPLCCYHAEHFVFDATPPEERRCTAITASGERCTLWTLADGGRLCSIHAGETGWQMKEWPLPDEVRCRARRSDGERCEGRALVDGLCPNHAGLTGWEKGHEINWKHGLYARPTAEELAAIRVFAMAQMSEEDERRSMIAVCRVMLSQLLGNLNDPEVNRGWGVTARHARLIFRGVEVIRELMVEGQ
jgi:hypothetical protein